MTHVRQRVVIPKEKPKLIALRQERGPVQGRLSIRKTPGVEDPASNQDCGNEVAELLITLRVAPVPNQGPPHGTDQCAKAVDVVCAQGEQETPRLHRVPRKGLVFIGSPPFAG